MGQNESNPVRNMDKRTARREYRDNFTSAISSYRYRRMEENEPQDSAGDLDWETGIIRVCVRKRPIFKDEISHYEFDVVTCVNQQTIVVHDARMHSDMKRMFLKHYEFKFDRIFNERNNNDEVYLETAAPMTQFAVDGGFATCLMYGQTGSGKTYTMSSIYERAAIDIFQKICDRNYSISISFCEISGENCFDLLNSFQPAQLLTGRDGGVYAYPLVEPEVTTEQELLAFIAFGCRVRTTAATGVHDSSSRSHALLKIYILNNQTQSEGVLTLVDLAGSEHKIDSMYHSAERRKEGAAINSSLMALKECIRAKAAGKDLSHFYRKSKLTMALKSSFSDPSARTTVIVTVSPASKDTEHSLNSLRHACIMDGQDASSQNNENRFVTGGDLSVECLGEINISAIAQKNRKHMEELKTSNGNTFGSDKNSEDKPLSDKEKIQMRRAAERAAIKSLTPPLKALLKSSRERLGDFARQQSRLNRQSLANNSVVTEVDEPVTISTASNNLKWQFIEKPTTLSIEQLEPSESLSQVSPRNDIKPATPSKQEGTKIQSKNRRPVHKLRMSIYGSDDGVPEDIKRRQFGVLLKQNGYSKAEIGVVLQEEERKSSQAQPLRRESSLHEVQSDHIRTPNRMQTMSAGSHRVIHQDAPSISIPQANPSPQISRHEAAKQRRLQMESDAASKKANRLKKTVVPNEVSSQDPNDAIAALESELQDPNLTTAARHGLMKRIATLRSVQVREARWREQEKRDAEKHMKQMKLAAAAEEAKRRLGIPYQSPIGAMSNTAMVENALSPRKPNHTNHIVGPFSGGEEPCEHHQPSSSNYSLGDNKDSLDQYIQQPIDSQGPRARSRGRARHSTGASSAPFANEFNWDS